jgi:hypothetical protein
LHQPNSLIPAGILIDPIQDVMRAVSGTPALRFHHLRHSCATFNALRLLESHPGELFPREWACNDEGEIIMPHWGENWYAVLCGEERYVPAFDKIQYLGVMMGHASPAQTVRTYTHVLDYAVGMMRWLVPMKPLKNKCQAELLGFTEENLAQRRGRRGLVKDTTPAQLAEVLGRWAKGGRTAVDKKFIAFEMVNSPGEVKPVSSQMPASALLIYRALDRISQLTQNGAQLEKAIAGTAELCGLSEASLLLCYQRGDWLMEQYSRNFREDHPDQRNAFSLGKRPDDENIARRNGVGGVDNPVQRRCPAPPKRQKSHSTVELLYRRLVDVADSDAERFRILVENVVKAMQRSHTHLKFPTTERKILYLNFLEIIDFLPLAWVDVRAPENGLNESQLKDYWSKELSLPRTSIRVRWDDPVGPRNAMGVAHIEFDPPPEGFGNKPLQHAMTAVRFVAFVSLIGFGGRVYVDEEIEKERAIHGHKTYTFVEGNVLPSV